jgi:hypothetical protein
MTYLLLVHHDENEWLSLTEAERQAIMAEPMPEIERLTAAGKFLGGSPLHPASAAATVRPGSGKPLVTDGPFAETREQVAGYCFIEAQDRDEAVAIAASFVTPSSRASIEVRAVVGFKAIATH